MNTKKKISIKHMGKLGYVVNIKKPKDWRSEALRDSGFKLPSDEPKEWMDTTLALILGLAIGAMVMWAGTPDRTPLTDSQIDKLASKCYLEGDNVPNEGVILPDGTIKREI